MKPLSITFYTLAFLLVNATTQTTRSKNNTPTYYLAQDSIFFTSDYYLIGDSCADIVRLGLYYPATRKFAGKFTDVSRLQPQQVLAEATFDENGVKQGPFKSYYMNGNLQAEGGFSNNMFSGKCNFFYPDGKPKISLAANGNDVKILDTWNEEGKKIVNNGYGYYESIIGPIAWEGKLVGGKPDGKWVAKAMYMPSDKPLVTEKFKLGTFQKGTNQVGDYKDSSRILLVSGAMLPFIQAELLWHSPQPCKAARQKNITNAWYAKGDQAFAEEIKDRLEPVLNKTMPGTFYEPAELLGKILEDGRIIFDAKNPQNAKFSSALIFALHSLPSLKPARVDNKVVQQNILVIVNHNSSVYNFSYRLLPITGK